ncbi:unnamed protein product [Acanthoscelides obtectus]|uniref:PiggyBac transposable element-derived protein domain-containing protein n=1 Tax=Acanthoscelides obtectus TaxID=200917 RepID=A0A9P0KGL5_ACAOB|nr:unnamed protein product [Acanthoscelides obtectus]CAK1650962.1 PiggyBac transposable element-derived protein 4 [Acanthoscelides obtectus]
MKLCLRYLGDPGYQQGIGQELSVSQATVSRTVDRVVNSIVAQSNEWIKFPTTNHELLEAKRIWQSMHKFPTAIDSEANNDVPGRPSSRADYLNNEPDNDSDSDLRDVWEDIKTSSINFDLHNEQCTLDPDINQQTIKRTIDIFERFITDEIIDVLVLETNRYAGQQVTKSHSGRVLVIDESMVPFRGRLKFRQYIPNKTHRYGVKLYKLCTSSGYTYNLKVYTGEGDMQPELGHAQSIVLKLLEDVNPKEGRILYADNFYSGIPLVKTLLNQKCLYCDTLRSNRKGVPKEFTKKNNKGKKKNRKEEDILKPQCVIDYNLAKKGADFNDQMSSYHTAVRKTLKWYRKVMFELLLGTTVVNSWIVYNTVSDTKLSIMEFRTQLAKDLIIEQAEVPKQPVPSRKRQRTFVKPEGPGRKKRRPCTGCYKKLRITMTSREADKKVRRYDMNANPVPPYLTTSSTPTFILSAKLPNMPNIIKPANTEVKVSRVVTTIASLKMSRTIKIKQLDFPCIYLK